MTAARRRDEPASDEPTTEPGFIAVDSHGKQVGPKVPLSWAAGIWAVARPYVVGSVGSLLLALGIARGAASDPPAPTPAIESRVVALEVERKGDDKRIEKLEDAMRDLDKDVRELLKLRAKSGG